MFPGMQILVSLTLDQEGQVVLTNINNYIYEVTQTGGYKYNIAWDVARREWAGVREIICLLFTQHNSTYLEHLYRMFSVNVVLNIFK